MERKLTAILSADVKGYSRPRREKCLHTPKTRHKHLAIFVEQVQETVSQQRRAKIDTPEARGLYGQRLAIVEPVLGNLCSQKQLDHFTLRGKIKVNLQWRLYCMVQNIEKILHYSRAVERWSRGGLQPA